MSPEEVKTLDKFCSSRGRSISDLMRQAIESIVTDEQSILDSNNGIKETLSNIEDDVTGSRYAILRLTLLVEALISVSFDEATAQRIFIEIDSSIENFRTKNQKE